jgi:hypothetical protein
LKPQEKNEVTVDFNIFSIDFYDNKNNHESVFIDYFVDDYVFDNLDHRLKYYPE